MYRKIGCRNLGFVYVWLDALTNYLTVTGFGVKWDVEESGNQVNPRWHFKQSGITVTGWPLLVILLEKIF